MTFKLLVILEIDKSLTLLQDFQLFYQQSLPSGQADLLRYNLVAVHDIGSNSGGARWDGKDPNQTTLIGMNAVDFLVFWAVGLVVLDGIVLFLEVSRRKLRKMVRDFPLGLKGKFLSYL